MVALLVAGHAGALAAGTAACAAGETTAMACTLRNGRQLRICQSAVLNRDQGYLQYRYGQPGAEPELVYPPTLAHPAQHFHTGRLSWPADVRSWLSFEQGGYQYLVYSEGGRNLRSTAGVVVSRGARTVLRQVCRPGPDTALSPALHPLLLAAGVPRDANGSD